MKRFNFLKRLKVPSDSGNGVLGLSYLEGHTALIAKPRKLKKFEWRRSLKSSTGNKKLQIKYYGNLHEKYKSLIVSTAFGPQKLVAIDSQTREEFLIYDGCKVGYNALLCDSYSKAQIEGREALELYKDNQGNNQFTIIISVYYQIDYDDEFAEHKGPDGKIELLNGERIPFEELKRLGCDCIQIWLMNPSGKKIQILSEELA